MSLVTTLRALFRPKRYEAELDEELRFHLAARAAEHERAGVPAADARRRARLELGGWESHKDGMRQAHGLRWLDEVIADVRYASRTLRRSPAFTLVAVGSLALAIGANTNIFSVTHQLLYLRLGVPHPKELRMLSVAGPSPSVVHIFWGSNSDQEGQYRADSIPYPIFKQLQAKSRSLAGIAGFKDIGTVNVTAEGVARPQTAQLVSGNLYQLLEMKPKLGRGILPSDEGAAGTGFVAVLSNRYWKAVFGGRKDVIGRTIRVNGNIVTIVGVNPAGFTGAASTTVSPDLFLPISLVPRLVAYFLKDANFIDSPRIWWVNTIARVRPGVADAKAAAELSLLLESAVRSTQTIESGEHIPHMQMDDGSHGLRFFNSERTPLQILLGLTGLVLLLACANIANLMLARTAARMREMSVRLALGATRLRILRQIITESLLLSATGGAAGLLLGYLGRNLLVKLYIGRAYLSQPVDIRFDWTVFAVTAAVTIGTGLLFGILPAWRATRSDVSSGLKDNRQGATRRRSAWTGKLLISFQLALSTLLVAGAALFVRTLWNLDHVDPGFRTANLLEFDIDAPSQRYPGPAATELLQRIQQRLSALPGLGQLAMAQPPLLNGTQWNGLFQVEGMPKPKKDRDLVLSNLSNVSPGFLKMMGIPLLRGRDLTEADTATSTRVSVINESAAKKFYPGMDPVGRRFELSEDPDGKEPPVWNTVVGICADTQYSDLKQPRQPLHFDPIVQNKVVTGSTFLVRTSLPASQAAPMIRRAIAGIDPDLPLMDVRTLDEQIADSLHQERLIATLTAGFGLLALLLASVGIYGLMAYTVSQRTNEIGIRLALGARRMQVRAIVLREITGLALTGVIVGGAGVLVAIHLMRSMLFATEENFHQGMLFGVREYDPASLAATATVLFAVALLAGWIPAARASRVEPMEALRHE